MQVRLIAVTQPAITHEDGTPYTPEGLMAYCARVSSPHQDNPEYERLLRYCIKQHHWSVFEQVDMTLEVQTSRAAAAQILRHRAFVFQEHCIAGDSTVKVETDGVLKPVSIESLYEQQLSGQEPKTARVYSTRSGTYISAGIKEVFSTGIKPLYEVKVSSGHTIKTTMQHKFLTRSGFQPLEALSVGYEVVLDIPFAPYQRIESITYIGDYPTYDLEVNHSSHNYVANEFVVHNSQRYAEVVTYEESEARRQDLKNRQNSIDDLTSEDKEWFARAQEDVWDRSYDLYREALNRGIAKECARFLLPLNTQTRLYMKGSVRSWIHYIEVRTDSATQKEHREIALEAQRIFVSQFPTVSKALNWV